MGIVFFSKGQVFKWFKAYLDGRESIKDEPRSERPPSTAKHDENIVRIWDLVQFDRRLTVRMIGEQ
jgi:hypothetical protein